nr:BTAD domain-containing putative transcriptional regulator [Kibdelosporangium sp. MJ126-NF4]CEL22956.1 putative regulatory protein [Kibdelosporangium sp. MJ126-NF4]CTQ90095.1 putative regulatory protein [Kibdelosporangium sp. MJ126-NF4]
MVEDTDFRLLGTLDVTVAGRAVTVRVGKQQVVLAGLLLRANQLVRVSELVDWLWDDETPDNAASTAQAYVRRLRQTLQAKDLIATMPHGYRINLGPEELDLARFRALVGKADQTDDPGECAELVTRALAQWRGPALADIPACSFREREVQRLTEEHLRATEMRLDCDLLLGKHAELLPELHNLTIQHPFRERLRGQLMLALYRSGRQVEALASYQEVRGRLADEVGVDPGEDLQRLHQRILTNDPALSRLVELPPPEPAVVAQPEHRPVPRQLPAGLRDFVGRDEAYEQIIGLLSGDGESGGVGAPVVAISGQPGVGKTALAVQAAHRLRAQFPDGQLFVDLLGNALDRELTPEQVLGRFLQAFGLKPEQLPDDHNGLVGAYRTLLADRRVLVVLDNAVSATQVRSLLPSMPGSAALVTSRKTLRGLAALGGAKLVNLDVLAPEQSLALLNTIVGQDHARPDPDALEEIARLCGHLPLALRIAGANLLLRDDDSMQAYVTDLRHGNRLTALEIEDDPSAAVRAVFDLSYLTLKPEAARLFRLLGLVPGPDFSQHAVAVLARLADDRTEKLLSELATASLIQRISTHRFRFHDLLRLYSQERCQMEENADESNNARARLFAFYVRRLDAIADVLYGTWVRLPRTELEESLPSPSFADSAAAVEWMDQEGPNVIAAILYASGNGPKHAAWHLVESLHAYLMTRGHYRAEGLVAARAALQAARAAGEPGAAAAMHHVIGAIYLRVHELGKAMEHLLAELDAYTRSGSQEGRARAMISVGTVYQVDGKLRAAAEEIERGVQLAQEHGYASVRLYGLINLGVIEEQRGRLDRAEQYAHEALALIPFGPSASVEGTPRDSLGHILVHQGRYNEAIVQYDKALACYRESGTRHYEAETLRGLADANRLAGDHAASLEHAREALALSEQSGVEQDQVDALVTLSATHQGMGHVDDASACARKALEMSRRLSYLPGEISALLRLASQSRERGNQTTATEHATTAAELSRKAERLGFEARSERLLAWLAYDARDLAAARDHAERALAVNRSVGAHFGQAQALHVLGLAWDADGDRATARACWEEALVCIGGLEIPNADELRRLLARH